MRFWKVSLAEEDGVLSRNIEVILYVNDYNSREDTSREDFQFQD